jgi:plastocyanin
MSEPQKPESRENILLPILFPLGVLGIIASVLFLFSRVLLAISHNAATVVACITATAVITVASVVAARKRLTGAALLPMVGTIFGIALIAGGVAIVAVGPQKEGGEGPAPIVVALSAPVGAAAKGFTPTKLSFQENVPTTLNFDNQDPTVSHNVVIFQGKDGTAPVVFTGSLTTGPSTTPYNVPGLAAGSYFFHCEVHPTTMTGTITVTPAPAGGTGGSTAPGLSITAANIAFSTKELDVTANTPTPLTFINNDPATTHNVSVYKDAGYTTDVFKGDSVTGPNTQTYQLPALSAGTYYFKCDFHPTMTGTLVVTAGPGGGSGSGTPAPGSASASASASGSGSGSPSP